MYKYSILTPILAQLATPAAARAPIDAAVHLGELPRRGTHIQSSVSAKMDPEVTLRAHYSFRFPKLITIKMICDGLDITLGEFFSIPEFDALEQEIK